MGRLDFLFGCRTVRHIATPAEKTHPPPTRIATKTKLSLAFDGRAGTGVTVVY